MSRYEFKREKIIGKRHQRSISFEKRELNIDEEKRTVELSFSSDDPILHWFGYCILDHSPESVRLERIQNTGALLWMHDRSKQIGAVSNVRIDADSRGRALAKFSRSELGEEKFQDVIDEICRTTSFGFFMYALDAEPGPDGKQMRIDDIPVYRCRDWEPFEVSLEPIPADTSVGVGRAMDGEDVCPECGADLCPECDGCPDCETCTCAPERSFTSPKRGAISTIKEEKRMKEDKKPGNPVETEETRTATPPAAPAVQSPEVARAAEFAAFGEIFGEGELARTISLDPKKTLDDVRAAILEKRQSQTPVPPAAPESVAERNGQAATQLAQVTRVGGPLKAFKGKDGERNALRAGHFLRAKLYGDEASIEFCRAQGIRLDRAHSGSNNSTGGVFVIPEIENAIIDLRIMYGVFRANAQVIPMGSDTKLVNRRVGGLTAYPSGPGASGTYSTTSWDQVELVARKWKVLTKLEDELEEDAIINFADTLVNEIAYAFTYAEDAAGFEGDGTSTYHGIVGVRTKIAAATAGLQTASGNAWSEITEADLLGVIGKLPQYARKSGGVKWYCSHEFWANVLERIALAKGGVTYAEINGELKEVFMGKPVEIVEVMPHTEANSQIPLLYGNLSQAAMFGDRRGVTIKMTDTNDTDFESDVQTLKGTERFDINVHSVGDASVAGPIVGLITAGS